MAILLPRPPKDGDSKHGSAYLAHSLIHSWLNLQSLAPMEHKVLILASWLWCQLFSPGRSLHPGPEPAGLRCKPFVLQFLPWCDAFRIWDFVYAMWCLHMPRQLRWLLPAACVKELAPPSHPASALPCLVLILLSAASQAQQDTWLAGAVLSGLILFFFLGDCFGLSMSKHMSTHPQAPSASAGGGKHLHFAPEPSLQGSSQHIIASELLLGLGEQSTETPDLWGMEVTVHSGPLMVWEPFHLWVGTMVLSPGTKSGPSFACWPSLPAPSFTPFPTPLPLLSYHTLLWPCGIQVCIKRPRKLQEIYFHAQNKIQGS